MMSDNNHDEKNAQKPKTPQTPFGGWASAPPKSQADDGQNGAPRPVVSNEDGSQRPAQAEDLTAPKQDATRQTQPSSPEQSRVKSFSDTFGVVKEESTTLPPVSGDLDDDEEAAAPQALGASTPEMEETENEDDEETAAQEQAPAPEPEDPFAWKPEETPSTHEPRRNLGGGESWMQANTSYEELQSSTRAALKEAEHDPSAEVIVEEVTPTINPYTFNKGEEWTAPPMDADTLAAMDDTAKNNPIADAPITEEERSSFEFAAPEPQQEEAPEDETMPLSPFNFTPYAENAEDDGAGEFSSAPEAAPDIPVESAQTEAASSIEDATDAAADTDSLSRTADEEAAMKSPPPEAAAEQETGLEMPSSAESQSAEKLPTAQTSFQAYKPSGDLSDSTLEESALLPEEANLLGETDTPPIVAEEGGVPSPRPDESPIPEMDATPVTPDDDTAPLPGDAPITADTPVAPQEAPLPEAYTPPSPEESSLPEQTEAAWDMPAEQIQAGQSDAPPIIDDEPQQDSEAEMPTPATEEALSWQETQPETDIPQPEPAPQEYPAPDMSAKTSTVNHSHSAEEIQAILQGHALWLESGGKNGRRANFRNADLQQCDLSNSHLAEASFRSANLTGVDFSGSDMRGADMSEAQLGGANFSSSSLAGAIFCRTDLRNAIFNYADLQAADFSGASLAGAVLTGLNLSGSVFLDTDLQSASLSQASLIGANLRGANLTYANLTAANLSNANCRDVRFDQAVLDGAVFEGANLKNASVQGASLLGTDLSSAGEASPEQRQETIQAEKEQLLQEWQRLKEHEAQVQHLQASIQQREMALQTDRVNAERARRETRAQYDSLEKLIAKTHDVMQRHRIHDRQFKYFGVLWFIFTILIAVSVMMFISALELNTLDWLELSIVFGGCALIMGLFIATTVRSIKLSNNLKQLLDMYEQQLPPSDKTGH